MICAIYCRLSKEDEDKNGVSESIQNQQLLLSEYAKSQAWQVYKIYCDEDYSGVDRQRPQFRQLLKDAENGCFEIILCKTQSRFTRDMELVEHYIHHKFVLWGIRFVTLVDHADSLLKGNKKSRQINGLVNEWYLEDLSENIKAVLDYKRQNGQYIASFPLYGYRKDETDLHNLLVDEPAAAMVREIFDLYLQGLGKQAIADYLNHKQIPNPSCYKVAQGLQPTCNGNSCWNKTTVGRILKNEMYIGTLVQGKKRKLSYKTAQSASVPSEQWIRIPQHHQPIIDSEIFAVVQSMLAQRTRSSGLGEVHLLAGKARCLRCDSLLKKRIGSKHKMFLFCPQCKNVTVDLESLTDLVSEQIRAQIASCSPKLKRSLVRGFLPLGIEDYGRELDKRREALRLLYLDKACGELDEDDFVVLKQKLCKEKNSLTQKLHKLQVELAVEADEPPVTRGLVALLLDAVCVDFAQEGRQEIVMKWLF